MGPKHFCLLILAAGAAACGCGHLPGRDGGGTSAALSIPRNEIKVQVTDVGFDEESGANFVVLRDEAGARELPIMIGENEAQAILFAIHGIRPERPMTHDLLASIIARTGHGVDRVVIADLRNGVYYAAISMDRGRYTIDSRPSDAIAIAMGTHAPIYVSEGLFENAPGAGELSSAGRLPATAHALGMTVEQLTPELAQCFGVAGRSGVLVSDAGHGAAAQAAIMRGDVIVRVAGSEVGAPDDFVRKVSAIKSGGTLVLTIRRGDVEQAIKIPAAASAQAAR